MPKFVIDDITLEVPEGTSILEAAKTVGITIPHFCWHPALGRAGACRACAVKVVEGPAKGVQMSCMLPVQEGMVVSTTDSEAVEMRRHVIEWLMINHPHDCPVCDEGGECLLQDFTVAGGHGIRRFGGPKRTHLNQDLGPGIEHEMNRCIQCYRCVRFYQEFAGGTDFGVMGSAARVYFGRFSDGALESGFSGNLVDICPTGVFTDKTARFRARYWDYDMAPSICPECSLGCATIPVARYRELLKVTARRNDRVNGWFICDRGRFADKLVNNWLRPRTVLVNGDASTWSKALDALRTRVAGFPQGSIALVGSARLPLEGAALLPQLATALHSGSLSYFIQESEASAAARTVALLTATNSASLEDVAAADCIVIYECDLRQEAPMLLLAVRQAWRKGAPVLLVGKGAPLAQAEAVSIEAVDIEFIEEAPLGIFDRPVVIFSSVSSSAAEIDTLFRAEAKFAPIFAGPNGCGAALIAAVHAAVSLEAALAGGSVKAIIAVETEIPAALAGDIPVIAAIDWQRTAAVERAEIVLPTAAWLEMDGTFINNEGRAQRFRKVMQSGIPVAQALDGGHPPRRHRPDVQGGDVREAWRVISELLGSMDAEQPLDPLPGEWCRLRDLDPEGEGELVVT
jgi:NADH-quinone oxidoreductase subunit G